MLSPGYLKKKKIRYLEKTENDWIFGLHVNELTVNTETKQRKEPKGVETGSLYI